MDRNAQQRAGNNGVPVALRKESVDRNARGMEPHVDRQRRSPQGERG